jgi:ABC-type uncharacterized transport system involved in gliding motility auxiliary subunit
MNQTTKSLISTIAGFAALGLFVIGLIYWAAFTTPSFNLNIGQWDAVLRILMVGAIVAFSIYLILSPDSVGAAASKRSTRLTANALVAAIVAIGIAVVVNVIIEAVPAARADLTAGQQFTLSEQTLKILQDQDTRPENVVAYAFYSQQAPTGSTQQQMEDLLKEYDSRSAKLSYAFIDPIAQPARARELGFNRLGTVVFDNGKKREYANSISEADFTSALVRLNQDVTRTVAFLSGHGERNPDGFEQQDYSTVKDELGRENYTVLSWNLVTSPTMTISDVTVLIIAAPQNPLSQSETQAIQKYLDEGGRALIMFDPQMPAEAQQSLAPLATKYGITPVQGAVLDRQSASAQEPTVILVTSYPPNDVTTELSRIKAVTLFPLAMGLQPPTSTLGSFVVTQMIQSSPGQDASWLETDLTNQQVQYTEGKDLPGPVSLALSVAPAAAGTTTDTTQPKTRLVVFSDADFASNFVVQQVANNIDLFNNSVSWLAGVNELVSIRAKDPATPRTLLLDAGQKNFLGIFAVFALPALVLLAGGFNWWRRR